MRNNGEQDGSNAALIKEIIADGSRTAVFKPAFSLNDNDDLRAKAKSVGDALRSKRNALGASRGSHDSDSESDSESDSGSGSGSGDSDGSGGGQKKKKKKKKGKSARRKALAKKMANGSSTTGNRIVNANTMGLNSDDYSENEEEGRRRGESAAISSDSSDCDSDDDQGWKLSLLRRDKRQRQRWASRYPNLPDPMQVLEDFVNSKQLRLVDLFFVIDKDRSGGVEQRELQGACRTLGINLNEIQVYTYGCPAASCVDKYINKRIVRLTHR